jgi:tRNA pseudouridine38-40 synthase
MPRYKLTLEYDGTDFVGWQYQANGRSVQEALEQAVQRFCGDQVRVHGAGRTDSGVHALGQCCHLDLTSDTAPEVLRDALNAHLRPEPVIVLDAAAVPPAFDARRDAIERVYLYRIINRRAPLALARDRAWQVARQLNVGEMQQAASSLVGTHDFTTFRAAQCQSPSPVRTLDRLDVVRDGEEIAVHARARSFLHHQVRAMVGTLVQVGDSTRSPDDVRAALAARDRSLSGPTAPSCGLYLEAVIYPPES